MIINCNVLNSLHEGFIRIEKINDSIKIEHCNVAFLNIFKVKKEEILNKFLSDIDNCSLEKLLSLDFDKLKNRTEIFFEKIEKYVEISAFKIEENVYYLLLDNVTQKKLFENKYLIYKRFTDLSNEGLIISDEKGKIIYLNRFLRKLLELDKDFKLKDIFEIYQENFKSNFDKILKTLSKESQWKSECNIINDKNELVPVVSNFFLIDDKKSSKKYVANIIHDMSSERLTNQILKENEEKLRKFQEIANLGSWEIIIDPLRISLSKEINIMINLDDDQTYSLSEITNMIESIEGEKFDLNKFLNKIKNNENLNLINRELRVITKNNKVKYLKMDGDIEYKNGKIYRMMGTCIDVTYSIELEKREQRAKKIESINQFSAGIAHNFNNILTAVQGYADNLYYDDESSEEVVSSMYEIKKIIKNANTLIRSLVSENHIISSVFNLDKWITELKEVLTQFVRNDISIEIQLNSNCNIESDEEEMKQILMNLISNSCYSIEERDDLRTRNKKIIIRTRKCNGKEYELLVENENYCVLEVIDNGIGIKPEIMNKIYDPFFTTKPSGHGSGIGLSTVFNHVRKWNGFINAESKPNIETKFMLYFPISKKDIEEKNDSEDLINIENNKKFTILLVEDDSAIIQVASSFLSNFGHKIITAKTGKIALEKLEEVNYKVDLIISDIIMPEMTGNELYYCLEGMGKDIPFIFTSGYRSGLLSEDLIKNFIFLQKPYELKDLLLKIDETMKNV